MNLRVSQVYMLVIIILSYYHFHMSFLLNLIHDLKLLLVFNCDQVTRGKEKHLFRKKLGYLLKAWSLIFIFIFDNFFKKSFLYFSSFYNY